MVVSDSKRRQMGKKETKMHRKKRRKARIDVNVDLCFAVFANRHRLFASGPTADTYLLKMTTFGMTAGVV